MTSKRVQYLFVLLLLLDCIIHFNCCMYGLRARPDFQFTNLVDASLLCVVDRLSTPTCFDCVGFSEILYARFTHSLPLVSCSLQVCTEKHDMSCVYLFLKRC